jgi:hypothetical protein
MFIYRLLLAAACVVVTGCGSIDEGKEVAEQVF